MDTCTAIKRRMFLYRIILTTFCAIMVMAIFIAGCGRKDENKETEKKTEQTTDYFSVTLADGSTIQIDANAFGIRDLPAGDVISYEYKEDERHLMDDRGEPYIQKVYRHQLLMEAPTTIDNLTTFFFEKTPHVITRRKFGNIDRYIRLVSTKDSRKIRELSEPYIVIDMNLVYPDDSSSTPKVTEALAVNSGTGISSREDQISALKAKLTDIEKQLKLGADTVSIPERRALRGEMTMLKQELAALEKKAESSQKKRTASQMTKEQTIKEAVVKIKIISYNSRQ